MVNAISAYPQGILTQDSSSRIANTEEENANLQNQTFNENGAIADTVEISAEAQQIAQAEKAQKAVLDAKVAYYEQFRPTHDGFSSYNISLGIIDPGAEPFSQGRSFEEVTQAARENLDKNYQKLEDIGKPYDYTYGKSEHNNSLFGELDRRALYAIESNKDGLFTENEQKAARSIKIGQQGMAMGLYNGPIAGSGKFLALPSRGSAQHALQAKAGIEFLDKVSIEEKATSIEWAHQRAIGQWNYEYHMQESGGVPENFDSENPLVRLIKAALDTWQYRSGATSDGDISSIEELRNEQWFAGHADRLDSVIAETRALYGV